jgi:hypothetical protein
VHAASLLLAAQVLAPMRVFPGLPHRPTALQLQGLIQRE